VTWVTQDLEAVTCRYLNSLRLALSPQISLPGHSGCDATFLAVHFVSFEYIDSFFTGGT
jgi:hypothetical protein